MQRNPDPTPTHRAGGRASCRTTPLFARPGARRALLAAALAGGALLAPAWAPAPARAEPGDLNDPTGRVVPAITRPSKTAELHFETPGVVREVVVREGDEIRHGQPIAQQDDRQDRAELKALRRDAESDADVKSARAMVDSAKAAIAAAKLVVETKAKEVERLERINKSGAGNKLELEKAQLEFHTAEQEVIKSEADARKTEAEVERAQRDWDIKKDKYEKQQIHVDNMKLTNPIPDVGEKDFSIVERIDTHPGEMAVVDPSKPSFRLVKNNPLWVDVSVPVAQAQALKRLDDVKRARKERQGVEVSHDDGKTWEEATVLWFEPVANASALSQLVVLQLANPENRSSGLQVRVRLPKEIVLAGEASAR